MPIRYSEVTPRSVYLNRRAFLAGALALPAAAAKLTVAAKSPLQHHRDADPLPGRHHLQQLLRIRHRQVAAVAARAQPSSPRPGRWPSKGWSPGPRVIDIDEILKLAPLEERIYRMRCVEGWSMVVPWIGFPLSELIKQRRAAEQGAVTSPSRASTTPSRCPRPAGRELPSPTSKGCGWMKP